VNSFTTETNIKEFLTFYRTELPTARVTPKLHMLEAHVIPWIRRWGVGIGFHNEQGAESIHTRFNSLKRTYCNIRNPVDRLKGIMKEHYLQNAPVNIAAKPVIKKRKKK